MIWNNLNPKKKCKKEFAIIRVELHRTSDGHATCVGCQYKDTEETYGSPGGDYAYPVCKMLDKTLPWKSRELIVPLEECPLWKGKERSLS